MTDETKPVSAEAGSAATVPDAGKSGETAKVPDNAKNYDELEKKFGEQGNELGTTRKALEEHQKFVENIRPLLDKLDNQPQLIQAILDDKIDQKLVSALLEGKVKIEDAEQIVQAQEQIKQEMGNKAFGEANPAEIEKRILDKVVATVNQTVEQRFKSVDEQKEFEDHVTEFINNTPDFPEYADKITVWLNEHPDQDDIEVAYSAVKGLVLSEKMSKDTQKTAGEIAKEVAANAGGGNAPSSGTVQTSTDPWDRLVSPKSNPNVL
jgi:hypothetical protein